MSQQCNVIFSFLHHAGQQVTLYEVCASGHYDLVSPRDNVSQVLSNSWSMGRYNGASLYLKQLNLISGLQFRPMPRCPGKVPPPLQSPHFPHPKVAITVSTSWDNLGMGGQETQTPPEYLTLSHSCTFLHEAHSHFDGTFWIFPEVSHIE